MWGLIPGLGRSPGGRDGNPLKYSCLENAMDRGAWQAIVHGLTHSQTLLKRLCTHTWEGGPYAPLLCFTCPSSPLCWPPDYQVEATAAEDKAEPQWEREGAGLPTPRGPCCAGSTEGTSVPQPSPRPSSMVGPLARAGPPSPSSLQGLWPRECRGKF